MFRPTRDPNTHRDPAAQFQNPSVQKPLRAWQKYSYRVDPNGHCFFSTPAKNMEATREIMEYEMVPMEEKVYYSKMLLNKAQEQQEAASTRSKLANDTRLCKTRGGGDPSETAGSSSHNGAAKAKTRRRTCLPIKNTGRNPRPGQTATTMMAKMT